MLYRFLCLGKQYSARCVGVCYDARPMKTSTSQPFEVIIIGAGAAGLMCALTAGQRGRRVLVLDHANKVGKKILMSGGGRCNFTHLYATPDNYLSHNPHFCKSALKRYTPYDFLALIDKHHIEYVHKDEGQLFCQHSAKQVLQLLLDECADAGVEIRTRCSVNNIQQGEGFTLTTSDGEFVCESLVIATGGLSIPSLGASGFGYDVARQFGLKVYPLHAALVPFTLDKHMMQQLSELAGVSLDVAVTCGDVTMKDAMLFTHRGLSGPVMLQISSYWQPGEDIEIDLLPQLDASAFLAEMKQAHPKMELKNVLHEHLPKRLAQCLCELWQMDKAINQFSDKQLQGFSDRLHHWRIRPAGTEGYKTAEVTLGGVDTDELSSKTMEANRVKGLYFIGEVVDVTGQLGGFNFQWAWSSGWAAGQYV